MKPLLALRLLLIVAAFLVAGLLANGPKHQALGQKQSGKSNEKIELPSPVVSTHDLMELFNEPLYKDLRKAVSQSQGNDLDWQAIHSDAQRVAEVANLVAIRPAEKNESRWMDRTRDLRLAALDLAEAAEKKEAQRTRSSFGTLVQTCNACHRAFAPKEGPQLKVEQ